MPCDLILNDWIEHYNVLREPTEQLNAYFIDHPNVYKAALITNHVFRALAMTALAVFLPFSPLVNMAICFVGSLFYRLTVEKNCAYKFALPAFAGSVAMPIAFSALTSVVTGVAFVSMGAFAAVVVGLIPLTCYVTYIVLTVNYDVDHR